MKKILLHAITSVSFIFCPPSEARGATDALWILVPVALTVGQCTQFGDEVRNRFRTAISVAKGNSLDLLPPTSWGLIEEYANSTGSEVPTPDMQRACDKTIEAFSSPAFPTYIRQLVATYFIAATATECVLFQPTTAGKIKQAWISVGTLNGFDISEKAIDELFESQRQVSDMNRPPRRSIDECVKAANYWDTPSFDQTFSKSAVFELFGGR
ncbi:MAG: hypothetical protein ACK6DF_07535 [Betaproteobacteria bacterium]